jgi:LTXXQ motif family protein
MLGAVWRFVRFLVVAAVAVVMGVSPFASAVEARHRHHFGHYSSRQNHREVERGARHTRALAPVSRSSNDARSRNGAGGFADGVRRMIGACSDQVAEMKGMPFDAVSRAVRAGENQRNALEQIRSIVGTAADTLSVACPKDIPAPLSERLDTLGVALDAIAASLATLRPAFATFYETLDDEQKARLAVIDLSRRTQSGGVRGARAAANVPDLSGSSDAEQDPVCRRWVAILRGWPAGRLETSMSLSDEQHAALYDLSAAIYRAVGNLVTACPAEGRLTPLGRLDAKQRQLQALRHGIDAIKPMLAAFENSLNEPQKAKLAAAVY